MPECFTYCEWNSWIWFEIFNFSFAPCTEITADIEIVEEIYKDSKLAC